MTGPWRHRRRLTAVTLALAVVAMACGGGDDGDDGTDAGGDSAPVPTLADVEENEIRTDDIVTDDPAAQPDGTAGEADPPAASEPVAGGTVRYAIEADVDGLNPATSSLSTPGLLMAAAVFDTLAAWDVDGNAVPHLAESFTPNEDFTSWQVRLRQDISFHDGTPLDADALLVNFETALQDPIVGLAVRPFFPDRAAGGVPVEKIDDLTIRLNLLEPNAFLPGALTGQLGFVASPTWHTLRRSWGFRCLWPRPLATGSFCCGTRDISTPCTVPWPAWPSIRLPAYTRSSSWSRRCNAGRPLTWWAGCSTAPSTRCPTGSVGSISRWRRSKRGSGNWNSSLPGHPIPPLCARWGRA